MTEQEVDSAVKTIRRLIHHEVTWEIAAADEELDRLSTALKSALKDSERIDAMERCLETFGPDDCEKRFVWPRGQTLRQAIDERRGACDK